MIYEAFVVVGVSALLFRSFQPVLSNWLRDWEVRKIASMKDEDIDTSDIPEVKDWSRAEVGKFYHTDPGTDRKWVEAVNQELSSHGSSIRFAVPKFSCNAENVIHTAVLEILNKERENAGLPTENT